MVKSILVIGGGAGQVPLIEYARKNGYRAVVVSPDGNYPGLKLADKVVYEDIRFPERIIAHKELAEEDVAAVVTDQLDEAVPTVSFLAKHFNVPGIDCDVALRFKDKYVMRRAAENIGVAVPKCVRVTELDDLETSIKGLRFPLIIKPLDRASSLGVYEAKDFSELRSHFAESKSYSDKGVIVEEFVQGREYVVEGFTSEGKTTNLIVGHRDYFNVPDAFIPSATVFRDSDSATDDLERRLKEVNIRLVEGFGLNFGLTHAEYIYNEGSDTIYLVEVAARGGGVCISSDLIPAACGVDSVAVYMRAALGLPVGSLELRKGAAAYFCFMLPEGVVKSVSGVEKLCAVPGLLRAVLGNVEVGMRISAARDKYSRKGPILVCGKTKEDCYNVIKQVKDILQIRVLTSNGEAVQYWC